MLLGASTNSAPCLMLVAVGQPEDQGRRLPLGVEPIIVGSEPNCDWTLHDPSVSRRHAELHVVADGVHVEDLGSTNGIRCLMQKINRATVPLGSRLWLGRCAVDLLPSHELQNVVLSERDSYGELIGSAPEMRRLYGLLEVLEGSEATVLIRGETGTEKSWSHQRSTMQACAEMNHLSQ